MGAPVQLRVRFYTLLEEGKIPAPFPPLGSQNLSLWAEWNIPPWKNLASPRKKSQRRGDSPRNSPAGSLSREAHKHRASSPSATQRRQARPTSLQGDPANERHQPTRGNNTKRMYTEQFNKNVPLTYSK